MPRRTRLPMAPTILAILCLSMTTCYSWRASDATLFAPAPHSGSTVWRTFHAVPVRLRTAVGRDQWCRRRGRQVAATGSSFQHASSHVGMQRNTRLSLVHSPDNPASDTDSSDPVSIAWLDDDDDDDDDDLDVDDDLDDDESEGDDSEPRTSAQRTTKTSGVVSKWDQLNPKIRERIQRAGQERAMANKKKREPEGEKKRRQLMFVMERQREKKLAARVKRPVALTDRTPLLAMIPGMNLTGICISHTTFGAYVDVGTECDGLLHVAQMSSDAFVSHPRQVVNPGEEIAVTVRSVNPALKKLHLTMLPWDMVQDQLQKEQAARLTSSWQGPEAEDRIPLTDIQVDDELWGELKRVTDFGAYVEVGAAVDGFLHFMDHPGFLDGASAGGGQSSVRQRRHPTEFMRRGDRVRVWVSDVDLEQNRVKLTALRPADLPGPRRDSQQYY